MRLLTVRPIVDAIFPEQANSITSFYDDDGGVIVQIMPSEVPQIIRVQSSSGFTIVSAVGAQAFEQAFQVTPARR